MNLDLNKEFELRQRAKDKADVYGDALERNYGWRISRGEILQKRRRYEEQEYTRLGFSRLDYKD